MGIIPGEPAYCWATMLLPYVEQKPLYDQLDVNNIRLGDTAVDPDRKQLLQSPLAIYRCPSDIADDTMDTAPIADSLQILDRTDGVPVEGAVAGATSSYVANCGYWGTYHPAFMIPGTELMNVDEQTGPNNGLFYNASHVADSDIPDGLSQTIAIGERAWFQGSSTWVGTANLRGRAAGGSAACLSRVFWRINAIPDPPGIMLRPGMQRKIRGESNARSAFGSYHAGGANFVFADGHAMFIAESIDFRNTTEAELVDVRPVVPDVELLGVFQKLGIRNDEQPTGTY
jgi:prepilin-type processing-associated H-X9-DG protein